WSQTCALPIWPRRPARDEPPWPRARTTTPMTADRANRAARLVLAWQIHGRRIEKELADVRISRILKKCGRLTLLDQLTLVQQGEPVAQAASLAEVVSDEHNRRFQSPL